MESNETPENILQSEDIILIERWFESEMQLIQNVALNDSKDRLVFSTPFTPIAIDGADNVRIARIALMGVVHQLRATFPIKRK